MLESLVSKCRYTRKFIDKYIPDEDLKYVIDAGKLEIARKDYSSLMIGIVNDEKLISELSGCCHSSRWSGRIPAMAVICTRRMEDEDLEIEKYRLGKLRDELYDIDPNVIDILCSREHAAAAAANIMALAACERGISSCLEAYFDVYRASRILRVPNSHLVTYLLALGFSNKPLKEEEPGMEDVPVFWNIYDK